MADHSKPTLTSAYANFVAELDARLDDLAYWLDPAVTTTSNVPTNAIRWSSGAAKWEKYNGSTWADLAAAYAINITGNAGTVTNGVYTNGTYSDPAWITTLAGSKISGGISGNAATATTLATARTINGVSFNGSSNISVNLNNSLTFNNTGSGSASGVNFNGGTATTISYNTVGAPSTTGAGASGTWGISISGNAATASEVTNGVYTTGNQTIGGEKTFSSTARFQANADIAGTVYVGTSGQATNVLLRDDSLGVGYDGMYLRATGGSAGFYTYDPFGDWYTGLLYINVATGNVYAYGNFHGGGAGLSGLATYLSAGVGVNQNWSTPTRTSGTWYQNASQKAIMVNIVFGGYGNGTLQVGANTSTYYTAAYTANDIYQVNQMSAIIPPYHYYRLVGSGATWYILS